MNAILRIAAFAALTTATFACAPTVIGGGSGGSGSGAGGGGTGASTTGSTGSSIPTSGTGGSAPGCPPPNPGMCSPTPCINGTQRTGQASCVNGSWVCAEISCSTCIPMPVCQNGMVTTFCCPDNGTPCPAFPPYCDLGNGQCYDGSCDDAGAPCSLPPISANQFDQSCTSDADCVGIYQGDICSDCKCPNAAINVKSVMQYDAALADAPPSVCFCPSAPPPTCVNGTCLIVNGV
jgi:hypothetical protein